MAKKQKLFLDESAIGYMGSQIVTGATAISVSAGTYYAIQFITDCTPTALTMQGSTGTFSGITYKAGTVIYGDVLTITAAAGESYILYLV